MPRASTQRADVSRGGGYCKVTREAVGRAPRQGFGVGTGSGAGAPGREGPWVSGRTSPWQRAGCQGKSADIPEVP